MNKKIFYSIALSAAALCMTGCADGDLAPDSNAYEYTDSIKALQYLNDYAPLKSYVDRTVSPDFKLAIGVGAQTMWMVRLIVAWLTPISMRCLQVMP